MNIESNGKHWKISFLFSITAQHNLNRATHYCHCNLFILISHTRGAPVTMHHVDYSNRHHTLAQGNATPWLALASGGKSTHHIPLCVLIKMRCTFDEIHNRTLSTKSTMVQLEGFVGWCGGITWVMDAPWCLQLEIECLSADDTVSGLVIRYPILWSCCFLQRHCRCQLTLMI